MSEKILVTGAGGCIGAWVIRQLLDTGVQPIAYDISDERARLRLLCDNAADADAVCWECGDISDTEQFLQIAGKHQPAAIIHLAALQVPFCRATPAYGARVNVVGTVNVFEAAKTLGIKRLVYASSVAADAMDGGNDWLETLYGAYKVCNEQTARVYWQDGQLASIGIRPSVIYGAARDQGISALPSLAMLAACADMPYDIPFCGDIGFVYAAEAAAAFIQAVAADRQGAAVFNLNGSCRSVETLVSQIHKHKPQAQITCSGQALPFPSDMSDTPLRDYIGDYGDFDFDDCLGETLALFDRRLAENRIDAKTLIERQQ